MFKKKVETPIIDAWMKENFVLVDPNTSVKSLKPYQRMVILRKPEGEKKCVIDLSLPYSEINKLQKEAIENGYANVFDTDLLRIIPSKLESQQRFAKLSQFDLERIAQMLVDATSSSGDEEIDKMTSDFIDNNKIIPIIKLVDENSSISLSQNKDSSSSDISEKQVKEVDDIDNVKFKIPLEELYQQKWDDFQEYIDSLDAKYADVSKEDLSIDSQQDLKNFENEIYPNQLEVNNLEPNSIEQATKSSDSFDQDSEKSLDQPLAKSTFFKNGSIQQEYENIVDDQKRAKKKINFYQTAPASEYEKVVLNKKFKMWTFRRKIKKN